MGWTRKPGRGARDRRRPGLEILETRQLLSTTKAHPASSPNLNPDGSTNFDQIIGASATRAAFKVDGTGQSVAVIDTGVNYNNQALGGGLGNGHKVIAGVDFTGSPNGVLPTWQHGTGVAGVIAGNDASYQGVAPGADIVALRVFNDSNSGSFTEIADALDWVIQNHNSYNITAVNLSVSDGGNYTSNQFANDGNVGQQITQAIKQLDQLNIPVVIAAGNSFDGKTQGLGFPAIVSDAVSVSATDANDNIVSDAQRLGSAVGGSSALKIAAPGVGITAPDAGNSLSTDDGTSFATPQVTGSIVLLQELYENAYHTLPTIAQLEQLLSQGAVTVHDSVTGINVGRLNVLKSAQILEQQITSLNGTGSGTTTTTSGTGTTTTTSGTGTTTTGSSTGTTTSGTGTTTTGSGTGTTTTGSGTGTTTTGSGTGTTTTGSGTGTTSSGSTSQTTSTPTPTPVPQTQVILNGVSIGNYSTAQLATLYPNLFAFLKGPVASLRIWAPAGSSVNLGPSTPSGVSVPLVGESHKSNPVVTIQSKKAHATTIGKSVPVVHKTAHKASKSLFSSLFPF